MLCFQLRSKIGATLYNFCSIFRLDTSFTFIYLIHKLFSRHDIKLELTIDLCDTLINCEKSDFSVDLNRIYSARAFH